MSFCLLRRSAGEAGAPKPHLILTWKGGKGSWPYQPIAIRLKTVSYSRLLFRARHAPDFSAAPSGVLPGTVGLWPDLSYMVQGGFQFLSLDGMPVLPVTPSDATHVSFLIILTFNPLTYFGI